jgi:hypothetical protein
VAIDPVVAAMAEKIQATVLEAVLDWGEHANRAERLPEGPEKEAQAKLARMCAGEVLRLAMGLAAKLRRA